MCSTMYTRRHSEPKTVVVSFWTIAVLILLNQPAPVLSQGVALQIIPEKTDQPREGDSVTLECRVTSLDPPDVIFWRKTNMTSGRVTTFVDDETGLNSNADDRFSLGSITAIGEMDSVFSQRVTIKAIRKSDEASYGCSTAAHDMASQTLLVNPADEFPVCSPYGPATVANGSTLSCRTVRESKIPSVTIAGMPFEAPDWIPSNSMMGQKGGVELTHTVNTSDNGTTFSCFAISSDSQMAFSCQIGPLTVITNNVSLGLSSADIAGIVVGSILILIIIALHFLCCRCTPRRWRQAKSYFLDIGSSSFRTSSNRPDSSAPDQLNSAELGNSQPASDDVPPSYESATRNEEAAAVSDAPKVTDAQDTPATSQLHKIAPAKSKQGVNAYVNVASPSVSDTAIKTNPVHVYDNVKATPVRQNNLDDFEAGAEPKGIKRFAIQRKGKIDQRVASDDVASDVNDKNELNKDPSVIYAKVNKTSKPSPDSIDISEGPGAGKSPKKIKRFAVKRKKKTGKETSPPRPDPVIVYTELDLPESQGGVRSPKEPRTQYAEIKY